MAARLELLDQYLGEFDPLPTARKESVIQWQKKRSQPWALEQKVAGGTDAKTIFTLNWLINDEKLDGQVKRDVRIFTVLGLTNMRRMSLHWM